MRTVYAARMDEPGAEPIDLDECDRFPLFDPLQMHLPYHQRRVIAVCYVTRAEPLRGAMATGDIVQEEAGRVTYFKVHPLQIAWEVYRQSQRLPRLLERFLPLVKREDLSPIDMVREWERSGGESALVTPETATTPAQATEANDEGKNQTPDDNFDWNRAISCSQTVAWNKCGYKGRAPGGSMQKLKTDGSIADFRQKGSKYWVLTLDPSQDAEWREYVKQRKSKDKRGRTRKNAKKRGRTRTK
jgi:hypothetical protein